MITIAVMLGGIATIGWTIVLLDWLTRRRDRRRSAEDWDVRRLCTGRGPVR